MKYYSAAIKQGNNLFYLCVQEMPRRWYLSNFEVFAEKFIFKEDAIGSYREFCKSRNKGEESLKDLILIKDEIID